MLPDEQPPPQEQQQQQLQHAVVVSTVVHENQRCWIGKGWTYRGLLPNDRKRFSAPDGSVNWNSLVSSSSSAAEERRRRRRQDDDDGKEEEEETELTSNRPPPSPTSVRVVLLGRGWKWCDEDEGDNSEQGGFVVADAAAAAESDGNSNDESENDPWMYARDFTPEAVRGAVPTSRRRRITDWVRYRPLVRTKRLDPSEFFSLRRRRSDDGERPSEDDDEEERQRRQLQACSACHVDSKACERFSQLFLEALAYCCLLEQPPPPSSAAGAADGTTTTTAVALTDRIAMPLKYEFVDSLIASSNEIVLGRGGGGDDDDDATGDAFYGLELLSKSVDLFCRNRRKRRLESQFVLTRIFTAGSESDFDFAQRNRLEEEGGGSGSGAQRDAFEQYCIKVTKDVFRKDERDAIASWLIQKLDPNYQLHCDVLMNDATATDAAAAGHCCPFIRVSCPNTGCPCTSISKVYMDEHDGVCPFKTVKCDCGDEVLRCQLPRHQSTACKLRDVTCPYARVGCVKVVPAKDMPEHVAKDTESHLLLAVHRMMEYETILVDLRKRVAALEKDNALLRTAVQDNKDWTTKKFAKVERDANGTGKKVSNLERDIRKMRNEVKKYETIR